MDHRSKCKTQNYKLLWDTTGENLGALGLAKILGKTPKAWSMKKKLVSWTLLNLRTSLQDTLREWKDKTHTGRKYLQNTYLIKDCYPTYTKNFYNSKII